MKKITLKYSISIVTFCMVLMLSACEDFLDRPSKDTTTSENFYKDVAQARQAVYGAYSMLASRSLYADKVAIYYHMETDETRSPSASRNTNNWRSIARYGQVPSNPDIRNLYAAYYDLIEKCNDCIDNIPNMDIWYNNSEAEGEDVLSKDQITLRQLYAEAIFLRAIAYNDLICFFGDVPYKTKSSDTDDDFDMVRDSRDLIYDNILEQMEQYVDWLPWFGESGATNERISRGAAKGFIARIALRAAGSSLRWNLETYTIASTGNRLRDDAAVRLPELYAIAKKHAGEVIDNRKHTLNPDFRNIFYSLVNSISDTEFGERMFEVAIFEGLQGGGVIASYNSPSIAYSEQENHSWGEGKGYTQAMPNYYYKFHPEDTRRDVTNCRFGMNADGKLLVAKLLGTSNGKFRRWWIKTKPKSRLYTDVNYCMLRYSDVLLMYAEADWWLANGGARNGTAVSADGLNAFNQVRRRAFGKDVNSASVHDLASLSFDAITEERSLELGHEGIRKWDLLRWGILEETLQKARENMLEIKNNQYSPMYNPGAAGQIPEYVYYQLAKNVGEEPVVMETTPPSGEWLRVDWRRSITDSEVNIDNDVAKRGVAKYWISNRSELLPLPQSVLDNSKNLKQTPPYTIASGHEVEEE